MSNLKRLLEQANRKSEDIIATFIDNEGEPGAYNIDADKHGKYIRNIDGDTFRVEDDNLVFRTDKSSEEFWTIPLVEARAFAEAILYYLDAIEKAPDTNEDGTVADLGPVPTGHSDGKREPYHSLDMHDGEFEDDGW